MEGNGHIQGIFQRERWQVMLKHWVLGMRSRKEEASLRLDFYFREIHSRSQKTFIKYVTLIKCQGPISYYLTLELPRKMTAHAPCSV